MATYVASVNKALSSRADIIKHAELCSADPDKLATIGCAVGQQVRIIRNEEEYALYTVHEACLEDPNNVVRMGLTGRIRLDSDGDVRRCDRLAGAKSDHVGDLRQ